MATLIIPELNPMKFVPLNPAQVPKYLSKHYHDYLFSEQIKPWQDPIKYCNKVQRSDTSTFQFNSDLTSVTVSVLDVYGQVVNTQSAIQKTADVRNPGFFAYEATINWSTIAVGNYYVKVSGVGIDFYTEPIDLREIHPNSLYLEYRNSRYHENVIFETGITFSFRVPGSIGFLVPSSSDQIFNDQRFNSLVLSSKPYRNFRISFGGSYGIPDWAIDKINMIFSCNDVKMDGKGYSKTSDSKFTMHEEENYPMRGISFEVREKVDANISALKNFTAYWGWTPTDPVLNLHTIAESLRTYPKSGVFADGSSIIADFSSAPINSFLFVKYPADQPIKNAYENDPVFIGGAIPDFLWRTQFLGYNSLFRFILTRRTTTLNPHYPTTFKTM